MYHIAHITSNQEDHSLLERVKKVFKTYNKRTVIHFYSNFEQLDKALQIIDYDLFLVNSAFSPSKMLECLARLAEYISLHQRMVPLVYTIEWKDPIHCLLGSEWGGDVGVLHGRSDEQEITATFQRLKVVDELLDLTPYLSLRKKIRKSRP